MPSTACSVPVATAGLAGCRPAAPAVVARLVALLAHPVVPAVVPTAAPAVVVTVAGL